MKRFVQGVGVGILLTTLIFAISYAVVGEKEMSDAQIKAKAKQLGMVEKEDTIFKTQDSQAENTSEDEGNITDSAADVIEDNLADAQQPVPTEEADVQTEQQTENPGEQQTAAQQNSSDTISFTVQAGEGATKISQNLQAAGLVDDAIAFDRYLRSQKYTTVILVGTYELTPGMSYEELASALLGR